MSTTPVNNYLTEETSSSLALSEGQLQQVKYNEMSLVKLIGILCW